MKIISFYELYNDYDNMITHFDQNQKLKTQKRKINILQIKSQNITQWQRYDTIKHFILN